MWQNATDETFQHVGQLLYATTVTGRFAEKGWETNIGNRYMKKMNLKYKEYSNQKMNKTKGCFQKTVSRIMANVRKNLFEKGRMSHGWVVSCCQARITNDEKNMGTVYQPSDRKKTMDFMSKYVRKTVVSGRPGQKVVTKTMEHEKRKRVVDSVARMPTKKWDDEESESDDEQMDYDNFDKGWNHFKNNNDDDDDDDAEGEDGFGVGGVINKKRGGGDMVVDWNRKKRKETERDSKSEKDAARYAKVRRCLLSSV